MPLVNYIGNRQESLSGGARGFVRGNAPPPPPLTLDFIVVGGGSAGRAPGIGGSAGGVVSGSAVTMSFNDTLNILVGNGGTSSGGFPVLNAGSSSISSSRFGLFLAGGALGGSGLPQGNPEGLAGPGNTNGGGGGSAAPGNNGVSGQNGDGGIGSIWVNSVYYAGGGGGTGDPALPTNPGAGGLGGGGSAQTGANINGIDGLGGGAAGTGTSGGSGIVIIRYSTASVVPPYDNAIAGGEITISGGFVYRTFTGSAQLTYSF